MAQGNFAIFILIAGLFSSIAIAQAVYLKKVDDAIKDAPLDCAEYREKIEKEYKVLRGFIIFNLITAFIVALSQASVRAGYISRR